MKKCKDCHIFCQQSDNGGICGMSNFGTVSFDDGCRVGDIFDSIYEHGYNKALDDVFNALLENTKPTEKYIDSGIIVKVLEQLSKE